MALMSNRIIIGGLVTALFTATACSPKGTTNGAVNSTSASNASIVSNTQASSASSQAAPQDSPEALVAGLYKQHGENKSPFFQTRDRALVDKYFEKSLAGLIWKDAVDSKGEVGAIEADPLYDAQDTEIKNFSVHPAKTENGRAEVLVSFENFGKRQEITYLLSSDRAGWKIADIKYSDGRTLLNTLKGNATRGGGGDSFFEGKYSVGSMTCDVKPVKMAFEVSCGARKVVKMFFSETDASASKPVFSSEDKGAGKERFVFDDNRFNSGNFIGADGKSLPVKKAR
jgi:hypothetical protein